MVTKKDDPDDHDDDDSQTEAEDDSQTENEDDTNDDDHRVDVENVCNDAVDDDHGGNNPIDDGGDDTREPGFVFDETENMILIDDNAKDIGEKEHNDDLRDDHGEKSLASETSSRLEQLYEQLVDTFSLANSTASTRKATGGRRKKTIKDRSQSQYHEHENQNNTVPITRRISTMSNNSAVSSDVDVSFCFTEEDEVMIHNLQEVISEEDTIVNKIIFLDPLPEDEGVANSAIDMDWNKNVDTAPSKKQQLSSPSGLSLMEKLKSLARIERIPLRRKPKNTPKLILKKNLRSLSVLVYGPRISRCIFNNNKGRR
jgi:hypothetical protein